jgi:hypothetical protein
VRPATSTRGRERSAEQASEQNDRQRFEYASDGYLPKAVFKFVHAFEPPAIADWARGSFEPEIGRAGFTISERATLARATARAVIAR